MSECMYYRFFPLNKKESDRLEEKVKEALEETIQKWQSINDDLFRIVDKSSTTCSLCHAVHRECDQCPAQPLCNGVIGKGRYKKKATIWAKFDDKIDALWMLLCEGLQQLKELREEG